MNIRTTSMLPEEKNPMNADLIEISKAYNNAYISKKLTVLNLESKFRNVISGDVGQAFKLYKPNSTTPINVQQLCADVNLIFNLSTDFYKTKNFHDIPCITLTSLSEAYDPYIGNDGTGIPNITKVKNLIDERACFIDGTYCVDGDPGTDATPPFAVDSDNFMHWHIDDNGTDSTLWMNPELANEKTEIDGVKCTKNGWLTIYGWLADNGSVLPQDCWVGLYGRLNVLNEETGEYVPGKWILLQVLPWIKGVNSTQLQYVCFNLPVNSGLWLKIKTGFAVNGHVGGFQDHRSITFSLNQPNSFVGYISSPENK